jgi:hypothetical protein
MIIQMCEAQWLSEERYAKHSRECEVDEEISHTALTNKKKKQD